MYLFVVGMFYQVTLTLIEVSLLQYANLADKIR